MAALTRALRRAGQTVAVVAVDPSSPFHGGALLGDRVRMGSLFGDAGGLRAQRRQPGGGGGHGQTGGSDDRDLERAPASTSSCWRRWGPGRMSWPSRGRPRPWSSSARLERATRSRPSRRASWRLGTCWWSTRRIRREPTAWWRDCASGAGWCPRARSPAAGVRPGRPLCCRPWRRTSRASTDWSPPCRATGTGCGRESRGARLGRASGRWRRPGSCAWRPRKRWRRPQTRARRREDWSDLVEAVAAGRLSASWAAAEVLGQREGRAT